MSFAYSSEREMYQPVGEWLQQFLSNRNKNGQIRVFDASRVKLASLIQNQVLYDGLSPDWPTWDIQIDVVGFVHTANSTVMAFVECKNVPLNLDHLAQLLGYARIARPGYAFLISPQGPNSSLTQLLKVHQRLDVLEFAYYFAYYKDRMPGAIVVAKWSAQARNIAYESIITTDKQKIDLQ